MSAHLAGCPRCASWSFAYSHEVLDEPLTTRRVLLHAIAESWRRREAVIRHCVAATDERVQDRVSDLQQAKAREKAVDYDRLDADREARRVRDELYSEEARVRSGSLRPPAVFSANFLPSCPGLACITQRQQIHNELSGASAQAP